MDAFGTGWTLDDEQPGFAGELSIWGGPRAFRTRKEARTDVDFNAALRQRGASGVAVRVLDLSQHGFRALSHLELPIGADVWLRLPGLEPYHATVAWQEGQYIGCAFERPLHPAVLDMIVRKSRGNA